MSIRSLAEAAPGAAKAVVFAVDARYAPYACFAAAQIARLAPGRDFDICLASMERLQLPPGLAEHAVRSVQIDTGGVFDKLHLDSRRPVGAYLRLALPAALRHDYRRIYYLDADVFVQGGDFSALLDVEMGPHPLAAVRDNIQWRRPARQPASFRRLGLGPARYLNSGALLIDVAAFNGQRVLDRCLEFAAAHPPERIGLDQELLNAVLHGGWAELHPTWNWLYTRASQIFEAMQHPNVVHFVGAKKPWSHSGGLLPLRFRQAYRDFMRLHYPELPPIGADGATLFENRAYLRKMLARHALSVGAMANYLGRFDGDLAVLE